jgi:thioredoxin-like negative regulator of GroEL
VSGRSADFNYKVALASGLKSLQGGRLRQADEQFRYLVQHFPTADGGYRGLAKVLVEQEDRPAALRVLLDGGAALAKAGERTGTISLYREAVMLDPHDLASHRRLAAALTLAGDEAAAAGEYVRYIRGAIEAGDSDRAKLESEYALERLPGNAQVAAVARTAGAGLTTTANSNGHPAPEVDERDALVRAAVAAPSDAPKPADASAPAATGWDAVPAASWETKQPAPAAEPVPKLGPIAADLDAESVEATAARYLAAHDPRGGEAALEAARRYITEGHLDAASDLLLQLIASGIADHEAQRLLVDVTRSLGKRDVAKAKVQLLVEALRLDGRDELAAEVEQLARAF